MLTGLRKIAEMHKGDFRLTANQNVIVANVAPEERAGDRGDRRASTADRSRSSRPAPQLDGLRGAADLRPRAGRERALPARSARPRSRSGSPRTASRDDDIVIRMTGCPNGCARPYLAEIGLVGKGPGRYNLYLGAAFDGSRLSKLYAEDLRARRHRRGARSAVRRLCEGARARRALRRLRDPRRLRRAHRQRRATSTPNTGAAEQPHRHDARTPSEARPPRMEALARLPVFFALAGKRAVVAGGSAAAAWKAELLAAAGARGRCLRGRRRARRWPSSPRARRSSRFIARAIEAARSRRRRDGHRRVRGRRARPPRSPRSRAPRGVPVNVIDKPAFCDFSFGAIVNRSPLVIGISTDGAAPVFGQAIRAKLEALIPRGFARWAEAARQWRPRVQALALSFRERRRFWERFTERAVAEPERAPHDERHRRADGRDARRRARRRLGRAGRRRPRRSGTADPARGARAAIRRRHPDRRSRLAAGARFRAARGEEDDGRQDRPRPGVQAERDQRADDQAREGRQARGAAQGRRPDDLRPRRRGDRGLPRGRTSRSRSCPAFRPRRARRRACSSR